MAKITAVSISKKRGTAKENVPFGECRVNHGIVGDAHAADWHRQVSFLAQESIDKMIAKGAGDLTPGDFAENVTTEGVCLYELPVGAHFKVGEVEFEVSQIGKECHHGCEIFKRIGDCVMPREGIFGIVCNDGVIRPGDEFILLDK